MQSRFVFLCLIPLLFFTSITRPYLSNSLNTTSSIQITNPSEINIEVVEGEDFASLQLMNPWDMNEINDLAYWVGMTNLSAQNGILNTQTSNGKVAYFFPLFQGFSTPISSQLSQELIWNKVGANEKFSVDPKKYDLLSYRIYIEKPSQYFVRWTSAYPVYWPTDNPNTDGRFGGNDGCYTQTNIVYWPSGWRTYFFDLSKQNGDPGVRLNNWKDFQLIRGIRIDPSASVTSSQNIQIDWVRLTSSSSSIKVPIKWQSNGFLSNDLVDIWVSSNPDDNQDVMPLVRGIPVSQGQYTLSISILPPGSYYFKLKLMDGSLPHNGCGKVKGESEWVGPLIIKSAPIVEFVSPSSLSGEDYATHVLGNPWDMADASDIITPTINYPRTINNLEFKDGAFCTNASILSGQIMSDSQLWLNTGGMPNQYNFLKPIDPFKYRYFSVRMKVELPSNKDIDWAVRTGWGSRLIWWNDGIEVNGSETKYGFLYSGWNIYTIDLYQIYLPASLQNPNQQRSILTPREQNSFPKQLGWRELNSVKFLRFDPLETIPEALGTGADRFCIDWILLTTENKVRRGEIFYIRYRVSQPEWDIELYFTNDPISNPTPENQLISSHYQDTVPTYGNRIFLPVVLSRYGLDTYPEFSRTVLWDTTNVSPGTYYICAKARHTLSTRLFCSEYPIIVQN